MGDMADYFLGQVETFEEQRLDRKHGISDIEAYELGIVDELGNELRNTKMKTCRCCGQSNLQWNIHNSKWRLFEGSKLHECPVNPLLADEESQKI